MTGSKTATLLRSHLRRAARRAKHVALEGEDLLQRALTSAGARQGESRLSADAQGYWRRPVDAKWRSDSHWRDGPAFGDGRLWDRIGAEHLALFEAGARMSGFDRPWRRILDWGCGGGANAVHFAPRAEAYIGVDISTETLAECGRQVADVCDTEFLAVSIDVAEPEAALAQIGDPCDIFLSFYVFELVPTPEYGERLLRIAHQLLTPGGLALIQIKYETGRWRTKPRRRAYRRRLADMTTYRIDEFWQLAERCGFSPQAIHLVPENEIDQRYAYYFLRRED